MEKKTWKQIVLYKYHDYEDVLTKKEFDQLPLYRSWDHTIELWPDAVALVKGKVYPIDSKCEEELWKFLDENLSTKQIQPLNSPIASSFFFIKKKDGVLHPVQDYCLLNKKTIYDQYLIPLISNIIDSLEWFMKLDICSFELKPVMNGKWPSSPSSVYSNPQSCFLDFAIHLPHFRE
jgi:hypothetical protein